MRLAWVVMVCAAPVLAQNKPMLDLSSAPVAPAAGAGVGTLALADQLAAEAVAIEKSSTAEARVRGGLRRLARELLSSGERAGQAGSARVVMGRTLAGSRAELDKVVAAAAGDPVLHAIVGELTAARRALETNADPDLVLRDGLALLSKLAGSATGKGGWIDDVQGAAGPAGGSFGTKIDEWSKLPGMTESAIKALRELDALAADSATWPVYAAGAERVRAMVVDAARAIESPPAWVPDVPRRILGEQFAKAVTDVCGGETRATGLETLVRLSALSTMVARAEALEESPAAKRVKAGVAQAVSIPAAQADSRSMESAGELLALASERAKWPEEKVFMRQLRPLFRILVGAARQTEQQLVAALPEVLRRPEAMTDPGVLAAISSHRRAVADVEGLIAVNTALVAPGEGEPTADKPWVNAANRVLKLSQDLGKADQKEAANAALRALYGNVERCWRMPGEDDLRRVVKEDAGKPAKERTSAWAKLSGGREAALAAEITDRRAGWLFDWEKNIVAGSDAKRLEALRALMELMDDAGPVVNLGGAYLSLQSWPGWELSAASMEALAGGLEEQAAEATRVLLSGDSGKAVELAEKARKECAVALLAGRLTREAQRRGISADRGAAGALRELAAGGPVRGRSWMGRETELLDDVCRYGEEVASLRKLGAKDKADRVQRFANLRAGEMMERMGRWK